MYDNLGDTIESSNLFFNQEYWTIAVNQLGQSDWNELDALSIPCTFETTNTENGLSLTVTRTAPQGILTVVYEKINNQPLKITANFTNLNPNWTNHRFRFIEKFVDINTQDLVYYNANGENRINNILSQDRDTFISFNDLSERQFAFLSSTLNPFVFTLEQDFADFQGLQVDVINGQLDLSLVYGRGQNFLLPNDTMSIDPTFGYSAGTAYRVKTDFDTGTSCPSPTEINSVNFRGFLSPSSNSSLCQLVSAEFDISSISDSATITDVDIKWTDSGTPSSPRNCDWRPIVSKPSLATPSGLWNDILDGTPYLSNDSTCTSVTGSVDLGSNADSDLESLLSSDWFAVGVHPVSIIRDGSSHNQYTDNMQIQVVYTVDIDVNISDGLIIGDSYSGDVSGVENINISDGLIIGDSYSGDVSGVENINISDGLIIGDSVMVSVDGIDIINISDGLIIGDSISVGVDGIQTINVSEGIILGESYQGIVECSPTCVINISDGLIIGDSFSSETIITTYNAIKLYVNEPTATRLGGVFAQSCTSGWYVSGIDNTGTIICTILP